MEQSFMKERAVFPLVLAMSVPNILSMLVNSLYNIVDSFFVARIGEKAMMALSLVYPVQNISLSIGVGFSIGINAVIAMLLGMGEGERANRAGISKSYGVPGLRLGILASADTALIQRIKKDVAIWNMNSFAEFYMQIFTKYAADYRRACEKFQEERQRFYKELQKISFLRVIPSQANYFLCEVLPPFNSHELSVKMLNEQNILIKDCSTKKGFEGRSYIRIAVRNNEDNDRLVAALKQLEK